MKKSRLYSFMPALVMVLAFTSGIGRCGASIPSTVRQTAGVPKAVIVWSFCGAHPDDPYADQKVTALAQAGVSASLGPCMPPNFVGRPDYDPTQPTYTATDTGRRYVDPEAYLRLTRINAEHNIRTLVYDARIWDDDPAIRQQSIDFWSPHLRWIAGWDLGDEPDPRVDGTVPPQRTPVWQTFVHRWTNVITYVEPVTGIGPYINHIGNAMVLDAALTDMPRSNVHLSFDNYNQNENLWLAQTYNRVHPEVNMLMCAVNSMVQPAWPTSSNKIKQQLQQDRRAGCDGYLLFGGVYPYSGFPEVNGGINPTCTGRAEWWRTERECWLGWGFGASLVNSNGTANMPWINAVNTGAFGYLRG